MQYYEILCGLGHNFSYVDTLHICVRESRLRFGWHQFVDVIRFGSNFASANEPRYSFTTKKKVIQFMQGCRSCLIYLVLLVFWAQTRRTLKCRSLSYLYSSNERLFTGHQSRGSVHQIHRDPSPECRKSGSVVLSRHNPEG